MLTKLKPFLTAKLNVWAVVVILVVAGVVFFGYQHFKQDHESLHVMVNLFNTCLAKPECKALFVQAQTPVK